MSSGSDGKGFFASRLLKGEGGEAKRQKSAKSSRTDSTTDSKYNGILQIRTALFKIEKRIDDRLTALEAELSSESEAAPNRKPGLEARTQDAAELASDMGHLFDDLKRIESKLEHQAECEDVILKCLKRRRADRRREERNVEELRLERDVLLEKVHGYLEQISSLKTKIEEQRCSIGAHERQVNAEYEAHLRTLENANEELRTAALVKEKQLREANEQLTQVYNMLRSYEDVSWRKRHEETAFISILRNDLQAIWNDKIKMEEEFKRFKRMCGYVDGDLIMSSQEDMVGTVLRRSKSMSDLTVECRSAASSSVAVPEEAEDVNSTTSTLTGSRQDAVSQGLKSSAAGESASRGMTPDSVSKSSKSSKSSRS